MAAKDLNFSELMRFARVQEARVAFRSNDPLISSKKLDLIKKADAGRLTQKEFDECINNRFAEIIDYMKSDDPLYTEENLIKALKINGKLLAHIPMNKQTKDILSTAFCQSGLALEYANVSLLDDSLVKIAIKQNPECKGSLIRIFNEIGSQDSSTETES